MEVVWKCEEPNVRPERKQLHPISGSDLIHCELRYETVAATATAASCEPLDVSSQVCCLRVAVLRRSWRNSCLRDDGDQALTLLRTINH